MTLEEIVGHRYRLSRLIALALVLALSPERETRAQGDNFLEKLSLGFELPGLFLEANRLAEQERFAEALEPALRALEISEDVFGPAHEGTAASHFMVASLSWVTGDLSQAREHFEKCLAIQEKRLGSDHPEVADVLKMLGGVLRDMGHFDEARGSLDRALAIRKRQLGDDHLSTAESLDILGTLLQAMGDFAAAKHHHELALAIRLRKLPADDGALATSYHNLGSALEEIGDLRGARTHREQALSIAEKAYGPKSVATANALNGLGNLFVVMGEYDLAERHLKRALSIAEDVLGTDHSFVATIVNNIAGFRYKKGDLQGAARDLERSLEILRKALGEEHPETISVLANLGTTLSEAGDLATARRYLEQALDLRERILGAEHPDTAMSLTSLGALLVVLGNVEDAIPLLRRSLEIHLNVYGLEHPTTVQVVNNVVIAILGQSETGDFSPEDLAEAERLLRTVWEVEEESFGPGSNQLILTFNNIAVVLEAKGDSEGARFFLEKALSIIESDQDVEHWHAAATFYNLAAVHRSLGDRVGLRAAMEKAVELHRRTLGDEHTYTMLSLISLGTVLELDGEIDRALRLTAHGLEAQEAKLAEILATGSEEDKALFLKTFRYATSFAVAFHPRSAPDDPRALAMGLNTVLRRKGRVLDAVAADIRQARAGSANEEDLKALIHLREERLSYLLRGEGSLRGKDDREHLERMDRRIQEMEREVAKRSSQEDATSISWETVQKELPECSVLIEMFLYWPPDVMSFTVGEPRYAAYVLGNSGFPRFVDLGEATPINAAAGELVKALSERRSGVRELARELYRRTFAKLEPLLQDADLLLIAPDDELHLVPFAALVDEGGGYLIERFGISYLTTGRDLLRLSRPSLPREEPLIVADPDFGAQPAVGENRGTARRAADLGSLTFGRLAGTADEARAVGRRLRLPSDRILTGRAATESALKGVAGPEVLHVATHGFFLPELPEKPLDPPHPEAGPRLDDPLLRSGLALAGFNNWRMTTDSDDGVLTAQEVAHLDLLGTEIVVLSACETGVGEVRNGRGVFGLRRALVLAGAKTQVMTLWQVADEPTKEIMVSWYEQVLRGVPRAEAMRRAQLAALRGEPLPGTGERLRGTQPLGEDAPKLTGGRHPYYWAPFIVSGEPGR